MHTRQEAGDDEKEGNRNRGKEEGRKRCKKEVIDGGRDERGRTEVKIMLAGNLANVEEVAVRRYSRSYV